MRNHVFFLILLKDWKKNLNQADCVTVQQHICKKVLVLYVFICILKLVLHIFFSDYRKIKATRDAYIKRLNGIYESNLEKVLNMHYEL